MQFFLTFRKLDFQMLAREILQDSVLPFLSKEVPDVDVDDEQVSRKVCLVNLF